jgi:hypothetical protein
MCHNPSFEFATKARAYKSVGQEGGREAHLILLRVQESVRE